MYVDKWLIEFNDYTDFTLDFNSRMMLTWSRDMEDIIEETMSIATDFEKFILEA